MESQTKKENRTLNGHWAYVASERFVEPQLVNCEIDNRMYNPFMTLLEDLWCHNRVLSTVSNRLKKV